MQNKVKTLGLQVHDEKVFYMFRLTVWRVKNMYIEQIVSFEYIKAYFDFYTWNVTNESNSKKLKIVIRGFFTGHICLST